MIAAILTAALESQAKVIVPALQEQINEFHAQGVDIAAHQAALNDFAGCLGKLTSAFATTPATPAP